MNCQEECDDDYDGIVSYFDLTQKTSMLNYHFDKDTAMLCSDDGRHLVTMPHIERSLFKWNWAYYDDGRYVALEKKLLTTRLGAPSIM